MRITADGFIIRTGIHRGIRWEIDGRYLTFEDGRRIPIPPSTARCKACAGLHWMHSCSRADELYRYFDELIRQDPPSARTWSPYTEAPAP